MITINSAAERIKELAQALGITEALFNALHPNGPESSIEAFASVLITEESGMTYKERLAAQKEAEGWKRV